MPRGFKYDVVQLIQGVRDRPCLWDKTLENYKDRVERKTAWEEICYILDKNYEGMTWEDKRITGEVIQNKWTNIRDTFVKTLKTKMGKPKKKYLLYDNLKFLTKVIPEEDRNYDFSVDIDESDPVSLMKQETECEESTSYKPRTRMRDKIDYAEDLAPNPHKKKKSDRDDVATNDYEPYDADNIDFVAVDESDPRIMNEDEAFFASLLPTVVKYSEDERLEFRIEVLAVMKKLRDQKRWAGDD